MLLAHSAMCVLGLWIGFFGLMMTFSKNIQRNIHKLNEHFQFQENDAKVFDELRDVVNFQSNIKKLSILVSMTI